MSTGLKANSDGSAAIQVGGTDVITLTSGGAATFVTSPTTVQAGTVAAPSITFSGDTNTGIYSPGADTIAFTEGGVESMRIDSAGNVGLGTTSPNTFGSFTWLTIAGKSTTSGGAVELKTSDNSIVAYTNVANAAWQLVTNTNHPITFQTNNTERARFNTTGAFVFNGGDTAANGIGITFPATQSASTNANTLDDYEEGTWTPIDASGAGLSFVDQVGRYTKIGRIVFLTAGFAYPSTANGSNAQIGGLPFTISDNGGGYSQYTTAAAGAIAFRNLGGTSGGTSLLVTNGTNTDTALTNANLSGAAVQLFFFGIV